MTVIISIALAMAMAYYDKHQRHENSRSEARIGIVRFVVVSCFLFLVSCYRYLAFY
jgi:heme/copper-type cytochrome/quinol oxidase subunit 3